jgi:phosphoglycolate phosphatase-like HAD superfamily hydrolase
MDIIFDIDGTLMDIEHRKHFVQGKKKKDWDKFIEHMKYDTPNKTLFKLYNQLSGIHISELDVKSGKYDRHSEGHFKNRIFFFSGRNESERQITVEQLLIGILDMSIEEAKKVGENFWSMCVTNTDGELFMRADNDNRPDAEVKSEMLDKLIEQGHNPVIVFDDRQSVVDMWRSRGLLCCQVADGDF